jgi:cyclophilin family peptidyl-prolyl cis-trans isomerase/HEAT repeat protein
MVLLALVALASSACGHGSKAIDAGPIDAGVDAADLSAITIAEDTRRADLVTDAMRTSRDVNVRRRAARALSRIADVASEPGLMRALGDEDAETAAWSAYGLGFSCKGHEEPRVRALVARQSSFDVAPAPPAGVSGPIDFGFAVARALGRCGGPLAESTLAAWVRAKARSPASREDAAYGLGDVGARRGSLDDDTVTALLDAAADGVPSALYPFARTERLNDAFAARLLDAAKGALAGPKSDVRVFAVRALAKTGDAGIAELSRITTSADYSWSERIDAMRSLGKTGEGGHVAAADALARIAPDPKDPFAVLAAGGDVFGEIVVGISALGPAPPPSAASVLALLSTLRPAGEAPESLARRFAQLRCTAASLLARGNYEAPALRACDVVGSDPFERGRLSALGARPIVGERRTAWVALTKSEHKKVREDALGMVGSHRELGDFGLGIIAAALADTQHAGVVASAADVLSTHPERALVLSAKERKNALDPNAPPPTTTPEQEVSPVIAKALAAALAFKWSEDAIETRAGLLDAAALLHAPGAKEAAKTACGDSNITMREHASKALHALGDDKTVCNATTPITAAKEATAPHGGKLVLTTDAGTLSIVFDPDLAPVASTRILDLASAGFYDGNVVHRVVPAFVVQLGDPQGDGYGGSGRSLRCETSPVPFGLLDVGIALGGRDTGSSQFFVTLGRFPHLDGDYARVGHAEGDWFAVAEGDVVRHVKVE